MLELEANSTIPNVINMTDGSLFVSLVAAINRDRPYDVAMFYSLEALNRNVSCGGEVCDVAEEQFIQAAYSYR